MKSLLSLTLLVASIIVDVPQAQASSICPLIGGIQCYPVKPTCDKGYVGFRVSKSCHWACCYSRSRSTQVIIRTHSGGGKSVRLFVEGISSVAEEQCVAAWVAALLDWDIVEEKVGCGRFVISWWRKRVMSIRLLSGMGGCVEFSFLLFLLFLFLSVFFIHFLFVIRSSSHSSHRPCQLLPFFIAKLECSLLDPTPR